MRLFPSLSHWSSVILPIESLKIVVSGPPRASESERIALQPVSLCCLTARFGVSGCVAVIATSNFDDVPATLDLLCVWRTLRLRCLCAHCLITQPHHQHGADKSS